MHCLSRKVSHQAPPTWLLLLGCPNYYLFSEAIETELTFHKLISWPDRLNCIKIYSFKEDDKTWRQLSVTPSPAAASSLNVLTATANLFAVAQV